MQRVRSAAVYVGDERVSEIGGGLVILLGIGKHDRAEDGERLAGKVIGLRIFEDDRHRMNRSLADAGGAALVVPQFTLYGDIHQGRRPDFTGAAPPEQGQRLYDAFCGLLRGQGVSVAAGRFGAHMRITLEADGPVTIVASTDGWAESAVGGPTKRDLT